MRKGNILPIAVMALAIGTFLFVIAWAVSPGLKWPWSTKVTKNANSANVACTLEAKICPDGSAVGRVPPSCEFARCPTVNINISTNANLPSNTNSSGSSTKSSATVIYYTIKSSADVNGRSWPTIILYRKVNGGKAETLATVGKVGEYPADFTLSPDYHYLSISLEGKVDVLDLRTKKLRVALTVKNGVSGMAFSQDNTQLFVWDQAQDTTNNAYIAHRIDLINFEDMQVGKGTAEQSFQAVAWRADGIVVMMHYYYPIGTLFNYNPSTNHISQVDETSSVARLMSTSGARYSLASSTNNPCNEYSGSAFSSYQVKDTLTGQLIGTFGDGVRENALLTFSPDDSEVLWSSTSIPADYSGCQSRTVQYYKQKVVSGDPDPVSNPVHVLSDWRSPTLIITYVPDTNTNSGRMKPLVNGEDWKFPTDVSIIKSFFSAS